MRCLDMGVISKSEKLWVNKLLTSVCVVVPRLVCCHTIPLFPGVEARSTATSRPRESWDSSVFSQCSTGCGCSKVVQPWKLVYTRHLPQLPPLERLMWSDIEDGSAGDSAGLTRRSRLHADVGATQKPKSERLTAGSSIIMIIVVFVAESEFKEEL